MNNAFVGFTIPSLSGGIAL